MTDLVYLSTVELEAGLPEINRSPKDNGVLEMIVARPEVDARQEMEQGRLDPQEGLVGDGWHSRGSAVGPAEINAQLTLMNARVINLLAQDRSRWSLAGDQLYVDLDLSEANLPPGTRLQVGSALLEVTALPHTGCKKFVSRFGMDAMNFVNSPQSKELHLRGIYTKVIRPGTIHVGDTIRKTQTG